MNNDQQILDQLEHMGREIALLTDSAKSLRELRDDLSPRVNEAVKILITELAEIEGDFQLDDLLTLIRNLTRNIRNLTWTLDQLKSLIDFLGSVEPLLKSAVPQAIFNLDRLEQGGVFRIFAGVLGAMQQIAETYAPEDIDQIVNGLVPLIGVAKKLTTPESLDLLSKLAEVPAQVDLSQARAVGPFGMLFALRDKRVKEGLGVALEMTKGLAILKGGESSGIKMEASSATGSAETPRTGEQEKDR
jgi:uncharacterized protein YjgD (DUF1641 family)